MLFIIFFVIVQTDYIIIIPGTYDPFDFMTFTSCVTLVQTF